MFCRRDQVVLAVISDLIERETAFPAYFAHLHSTAGDLDKSSLGASSCKRASTRCFFIHRRRSITAHASQSVTRVQRFSMNKQTDLVNIFPKVSAAAYSEENVSATAEKKNVQK